MRRSKAFLILVSSLLMLFAVSAEVQVSEGTVFNPSGSNASYYIANTTNFSQVTVYNDRVNFSYTNVSTDNSPAVNVSLYRHNFSKSSGTVAKYNYNTTANTSFYRLNSSKTFKVKFNGSDQRTVSGQEWLNVSIPSGNTNLTVEKADSFNSAPDAPTNPSPADGATNTDYSVTLSVDVSDPDGDSMDVTFWNGNTKLATKTGISSGGTASYTWSNRDPGTTYNWKAEADDGSAATNSSTFNFTTNYNISDKDTQAYTNFSTNHEFQVDSYAYDADGETDVSSCKVYYDDSDGNTGLLSGSIDTSYGNSSEVKCSGNLSSSLSGVKVGESVNTYVAFYDGESWGNTTTSSNTVPNTAPDTLSSSDITDLGFNLTDNTPSVQWQNENDPDNDSMTVEMYTGTSSSPTTLDNSGNATLSSLNLGQNVGLKDGKTYYYRVKVCDEYGKCSGYSPSDEFSINDPPSFDSYSVNDSNIKKGDTVRIQADVNDTNLKWVNFTAWEGSTLLFGERNGTIESGIWYSDQFVANKKTTYNYSIKAEDSPGEVTKVTGSFTVENSKTGAKDAQSFKNYSTNHEFQTTGYGYDFDGDSDISGCTAYWTDSNSNTGSVSGTVDRSYGNSTEAKCTTNLSNSITDIEVGESISVYTSFTDGQSYGNSTTDSNTVPNTAPTNPDTFTDLGGFLTDHTPAIQWQNENDPDNDSMTIKAYTGTTSNPTTLDNSASSTSSSLNLGQNVGLNDGTSYYYRLKTCDEFGKCATYTSSDSFRMNDKPEFNSYGLNNSNPSVNDTIKIQANISDKNIASVNFTVWEGDTRIANSINGTWSSNWSYSFKADESTLYNYTIDAQDNVSEITSRNDSFNLGYKKSGSYMRTYSTSRKVQDVKLSVYGTRNGGTIDLEANTSASSVISVENATWTDITAGTDITAHIDLTGDGVSTPEIEGYKLEYRTEYKSPGSYKSNVKDLNFTADVTELVIDENQPSSTNMTYEIRTGTDDSPPGNWTSWSLCENSCDLSITDGRYTQFRINLSGTTTKTPVLNQFKVEYQ